MNIRRFLSRRGGTLALTTVLTLLAAVSLATPAQALDSTVFELDGNATTGAHSGLPDDWDRVCHQVNGSDCSTTSNTSGATAVEFASQTIATGFMYTGGGSKDPIDIPSWLWQQGIGGLPGKDALLNGFAARYSSAANANCTSSTATCNEIFFGMDRFDNSGDAQNGFWFFQNQVTLGSSPSGAGFHFNGIHKDGDVLVVSDFSIGGATSTISVYKWDHLCTAASKPDATCADSNLRLLSTSTSATCNPAGSPALFCGIVNSANGVAAPWTYTDKSGNSTFLNGEFYEGGINLSAFPGLAQECFASSLAESRSSTSTSATLKSFVLGNFGNCNSTLTTTAKDGSGGAIPGGGLSIGSGSVSVKDSANLTVGGATTWAGSIAFFICGPSATDNCTTGGTSVGSVSVDNTTSMPVLSPATTVTSAGRYCWRGVFTSTTTGVPGASDNGTDANECFVVNPVTPTVTTTALAGPVTIGAAISDTATLSGAAKQPNGSPAGGTITFTAYGPSATAVCTSADLAFTSTAVAVSGNGSYGPVSFTPLSAGTYYWIASYSGNGPNTNAATTACGDQNETSVVGPKTPTITTNASSGPVPVGGTISDTANLSGTANRADGTKAQGTITFYAFGPAATPTCTSGQGGNLVFTSAPVSVNGDGPSYGPVSFAPTTVGTYYWIAVYSGDLPNTTGATTSCGDANETSSISPLQPVIVTNATTSQTVGGPISDAATISGTANKPDGTKAGGSITFFAYGPAGSTPDCSNLVFTSAAFPVSGDGTYGPASFTPKSVGTYYWIASYSGDSPNTLSAITSCGDKNEASVVNPKQPTLSTTATASPVVVTNPLDDTAHLNGTALETDGVTPAKGTITFQLWGPSASTTDCTVLLGTSVVNVNGDGDYKASTGAVTGTLTPIAVGIYNWTASYSGDSPNTLGVNTACGDAHETTTVIKLPSNITTAQTWFPQDSATVGGGGSGTVTFTLYKNDSTCSNAAAQAYSETVNVTGSSAATSNSSFAVSSVSSGGDTYYWRATYSGDGTHNGVTSCVESTNFGSLNNGGQVSNP